MFFATPWWLLGLVGWGAVTLWLLWGRRKKRPVPFLPLWDIDEPARKPKRAIEPPPLALVFALLAMLSGLLAAAQPGWMGGHGEATVTILIDRGLDTAPQDRLLGSVNGPVESIRRVLGNVSPRFQAVPDAPTDPLVDLKSTAADTRDLLPSAIAAAKRHGPVVVITNHPIADDPQVAVVRPTPLEVETNIARLSARPLPDGGVEVMTRLNHLGPAAPATLQIKCGAGERKAPATLPAGPSTATLFLDLPQAGSSVEAHLDDQPANLLTHTAWLTRAHTWPRVASSGTLPVEVARMLDSYRSVQPSAKDSLTVTVVPDASLLPPGQPAIIAASAAMASGTSGQVTLTPHPVLQNIAGWEALLRHAQLAPLPTGPDWQPILQLGGAPVIAVREQPARQVWIGLDAPDWPRSVQFVQFWKNALDWAGGADPDYRSALPHHLGPQWKCLSDPTIASNDRGLMPGLYQSADGTLLAINSPPLDSTPPDVTTPLLDRLRQWRSTLPIGLPLAPWLCATAALLLLFAALTWHPARQPRLAAWQQEPGVPTL